MRLPTRQRRIDIAAGTLVDRPEPYGPFASQRSGIAPAVHMLRKCLSCVLAGLLIVAGVTMLVMEPRKAIGVAAAFCVVAGILWLYDALRGSQDGVGWQATNSISEDAMPVYCLEPVKLADDHNWAASTHRERCWVVAESEEDARRKIERATKIATTAHHPIPTSPWKDQRLTTCHEDNNPPRKIPAGVVCIESGQMLSIK